MSDLTYTYNLVDGTTASASQVMQNFNDAKSIINGNISLNNLDAALQASLSGSTSGTVPTGTVLSTLATSAPAGFLLLDGATKNTADYPTLAAVLGAVGTTFTLPDARGRTIIGAGAGSGLTSRTHKATGGAETLAAGDLPSHTHTFSGTTSSGGSHQHLNGFVQTGSPPTGANITQGGGAYKYDASDFAGAHTHTFSGTTGSAGTGAADSRMQPWLALNYIVKT